MSGLPVEEFGHGKVYIMSCAGSVARGPQGSVGARGVASADRRHVPMAVLSMVLCALSLGAYAAKPPSLNAANGFGRITGVARATTSVEDGLLRISNIRGDHSVSFSVSPFFAADVASISIRYRAEGMEPKGGQLFYAPAGVPYSDRRKFNLPRIVPDGKWHVTELTEKNLADVDTWRGMGIMDHFRLDMTDAKDGWIEISEITFRSKSDTVQASTRKSDPKMLSAIDADPWPDVVPETWNGDVKEEAVNTVSVKCRGGVSVPSVAKGGESVKLMFDYEGDVPEFPLKAQVSMHAGDSMCWMEDVWLGKECFSRIGGKVWRLTLDYRLPVCHGSSRMTVRLDSPSVKCVAGRLPDAKLDFRRVDRIPGWESPVKVRVRKCSGQPQFTVNGKPVYALWGTVRGDRFVKHSAAPLNFVTVWNSCRKWWPRGMEFDPAIMDLQAEWNLRQYPDAMFIWDISIYPPPDWRDANPGEMAINDLGEVNHDGRLVNFSFASKKALADMQVMMERAIRYLEQSPYANRIAGYRINSGHTVEWLGWDSSTRDTALDFSPAAKRGFAEFAGKFYPEVKDFTVPSLKERIAADSEGPMVSPVRDMQRHIRSVAYNDFYSSAVADFAVKMCSRARKLVGEDKLIGTYFGYVMTLMSTGTAHMRAHFSTKRFLDGLSGQIDFLMSPPGYHPDNRTLGETLVDMKPFASIMDHGIMSVIEDDTRTHNNPALPGTGYSQTKTEAATVAAMRRNMGIALCRGMPFYTYAITSGAEFDFPQFADDAAAFRRMGDRAVSRGTKRRAQIAVVVSEGFMKALPDMRKSKSESFPIGGQWYTPSGKVGYRDRTGGRPLVRDVYEGVYARLARIGAPVDYRFAEDLEDNPGDYRMYIFSSCLCHDESLERAVRKLRERDCVMVWTYAPGFLSRNGNSLVAMDSLTGMRFERCEKAMDPAISCPDGKTHGATGHPVSPLFRVKGDVEVLGRYPDGNTAFAVAKTGKASSVFYGSYHLDLPLLQKLASLGGVHRYVSSTDPVEANDDFFTLHARFAGKKTIRLPKRTSVYDVFGDRLVAKDVEEFSFDAPLHSSWLFYCADDAGECVVQK